MICALKKNIIRTNGAGLAQSE